MGNLRYYSASRALSITKRICFETTLSGRALGYYLKIVALCENDEWHFNLKGFASLFPEGRDAISSGLHELEEHGYLIRGQYRGENGKFGAETIWIALDNPSYYDELLAELEREGITVSSKFDPSTVEQKHFSENEGFHDAFPQVTTDNGNSVNGSDQAFCESDKSTVFGKSENGADLGKQAENSVKPQVTTDFGFTEFGESAPIINNVYLSNIQQDISNVVVSDTDKESDTRSLDGWMDDFHVSKATKKNRSNVFVVGCNNNEDDKELMLEFKQLTSTANTPNRNRIEDAYPLYCNLREAGYTADLIAAAWMAYQGQDCFATRESAHMPQLFKWLEETGPDGAKAWADKLIARQEEDTQKHRRGVFRELMATNHEFEQLVREQDEFERNCEMPLRDELRKQSAARIKRITAILDNQVAATGPYGLVNKNDTPA